MPKKWIFWITVFIYPGFFQFYVAADSIPCKPDWFYFRDKCYKIGGKSEIERLNWEQASDMCNYLGGTLATIQSKELQEFLVTFLLLDAKTDAWIGLNDRKDRNVYVWEDGSAFNFSDWQPNEPLSPHEEWEECVEMSFIFHFNRNGLTGQWNDVMCKDLKAYICQTETGEDLSPDPRFCSGVQGGWKHQDTCYHVVSENKSWDDAERHCQEKFNGHLLTVLDFTGDVFLDYILSNEEVWIGIKIQEQSLQQWASGWYVGYSNWNGDESGVFAAGACSLRSKNKWSTISCSRNYSFICEANRDGPPVLKQPVEGSECPNLEGIWLDLGGERCYVFDTVSKVNWYRANFECVRRGGSLASIHSEEESITLHQFVKYTQRHLHIGLLRPVETRSYGHNVFVWADGSLIDYKNWNRNEPNSNEEQCGDLWTDTMTWWDLTCNIDAGYICSVRKVSPNGTERTDCPITPNVIEQTDLTTTPNVIEQTDLTITSNVIEQTDLTISPTMTEQKGWTSGSDLLKVVIGVAVCILLVLLMIGCVIYRYRVNRVQRRRLSSVVELQSSAPSS